MITLILVTFKTHPMAKSEVQTILDIFDNSRNLTRFYLSKLKGTDPTIRHEVNGVKLNNAVWVVCHLAWAENSFVKMLGLTAPDLDWLNNFKIGSDGIPADAWPEMKTAIDTLKEVHANAMEQIATLTDDQLDTKRDTTTPFLQDYRSVLYHLIRHENVHTGHLGWIAAMSGVETV